MTGSSPSSPRAGRQFELEIEIAAPREAVWRALTVDAELRRWFAPEVRVEPGVGGTVEWGWPGLHAWPQVIEVWEPGAQLRTRYPSSVADGDGTPRPLFMDFALRGEGGRTVLRLVHSGFGPEAEFDDEFDGISGGWPVELRSLRFYLERHAGRDRQLAWSTRTVEMPLADAWRVLTARDGLACGEGVDRLAAGQPFQMRTATGDAFEGEVLYTRPRELVGVARDHEDGFLRCCVESCGGSPMVWLSLATYGGSAARAAALQARWDAMLARLFGARSAAASAGGA